MLGPGMEEAQHHQPSQWSEASSTVGEQCHKGTAGSQPLEFTQSLNTGTASMVSSGLTSGAPVLPSSVASPLLCLGTPAQLGHESGQSNIRLQSTVAADQ